MSILKNNGVKYGLIYGGIAVLITLIKYYTAPEAMVSFSHWTSILGLIILLGVMYLASVTTRNQQGGYISFGEAFIPAFVTFLIGTGISSIFSYLLINHFDPSLKEIIQQATLDMQRSLLETFGETEDQILEQLEQIETEKKNEFTLSSSILNFITSTFIIGLPISAIIAAIVKKKAS